MFFTNAQNQTSMRYTCNRRVVLAGIAALATGATLTNCTSQSRPAVNKPNILFLAIDDLNDWIGALGNYPDIQTPNIDALSRTGMLFSNAHAQAPICGPSRASLMSGLHPHQTGFYGQVRDSQLRDGVNAVSSTPFLSEYFRQHGYYAAARGKVFHNSAPEGAFDEHFREGEFGPKPKQRIKWDSNRTHTDWGAFPDTDEEMIDFRTAQWGASWLSQEREDPFFLALGMIRPHVPWHAPQKWFDMYPIEDIKLPPWLKNDMDDVPPAGIALTDVPQMPTIEWAIENEEWRPILQAFMASVSFVDHCIGIVMNALAASKHSENTYVVLFSDNGYHLGEKSRFAKMSLWGRSTRVPLIISGPGISAGISTAPVGLIDIYPTLLELAGLPKNVENAGRSLVPLLQGQVIKTPPVTSVYGKDNFAVIDERYRYIRYANGEEELYDFINDPNEWENVAQNPDFAEIKLRLAKQIPTQTSPVVEPYTSP